MTFDVATVPFSRYGSFASIRVTPREPPLGPGLYLRSHLARGVTEPDMVLLEVLQGGAVTPATAQATPSRLDLRTAGGGQVSLCFAAVDSIRVRGTGGAGLRLRVNTRTASAVVAQPLAADRWSLNIRPAVQRVLVERLSGRLAVDAPWGPDRCARVVSDLLPGSDGTFEAALDLYESTWQPRARAPFEAVERAVAQEFAAYLADQPAAPGEWSAARELAAYINWSAVVRPLGFLRRPAMFMSKVVMDQVWSWDHCFNAMALAAGRPALAWDQFLVMFDHQDEFGALPDALNAMFRHYNFSKPPVHGWALAWMDRRVPGFLTAERVEQVYGPLARWSRWWLMHRTAPGSALPYYLHGNDSGWDNATMFDQGAPLVAPDLAAVLAVQLEVLGDLADRLGRADEAAEWRARSAGLVEALVRELWRGDRFVARRQVDGADVESESLIPCMPVVLGRRLPAEVLAAVVRRLEGFLTPHGLATERPTSPKYTPDGYWRGPIWAPSTLLVVDGLQAAGRADLAGELARRFCATCARSGFAENFDALTGAPLRDVAYTWTSSVFQVLAEMQVRAR